MQVPDGYTTYYTTGRNRTVGISLFSIQLHSRLRRQSGTSDAVLIDETERKSDYNEKIQDSVPDGRRFREYDLKTENDLPKNRRKRGRIQRVLPSLFFFQGTWIR